MSKKSTLDIKKSPVAHDEPVSATEGEVVLPPPMDQGQTEIPPQHALIAFADFTHKPGKWARPANTRVLKDGVRPSSPKALLHIPSVFA